jgi:hypothetical protein
MDTHKTEPKEVVRTEVATSLQHKSELKQFDDGSVVIDVQLHGNTRELQAIALGKTTGGFVPNILKHGEHAGQHNPDQLDFRIVLKPVPFEAIKDEPTKEDVKALEHKARGGAKAHDEEEEDAKHNKAKSA